MRRLKLILIIVLSTVLVITIAGGIFVLTLNVKSKRIGNVDIEVKMIRMVRLKLVKSIQL